MFFADKNTSILFLISLHRVDKLKGITKGSNGVLFLEFLWKIKATADNIENRTDFLIYKIAGNQKANNGFCGMDDIQESHGLKHINSP